MSHINTKSIRPFVAGWLAACAIASFPTPTQAAEPSQTQYNEQYRSFYEVPLGGAYTGRSPFMRPSAQPQAAPAPVFAEPAPAPAPMPQPTCAEITTGLVRMAKTMPPQVTLGQEFMYELNPMAIGCAGNVVITDIVPDGATYVRSEPPAEVQGNRLVWRIPEMNPGQTQNIKVWLRADREGRLASCATVSADPRACAETMVGRPVLAITKTGPEIAQVGSEVSYTVTVSNTGTAVAQGVVVTDTVPEGLSHASGQRQLSFEVGDLGPNQSRSIPVSLRADQRGRHCNTAVAASSNAGQVNAEACTTVVQPGVRIVKNTSDTQLLINRPATYSIVVSNIGDVPLTDVVVTDIAAPQTAIVAAEGGTVSGNTATWNIGQLDPGQQRELSVRISSAQPGRFCNTATVNTAQGLRESAEACSEWAGVTGVLVEVVDDPDPIQVGENTTFTIRVTNQGTTRDIQNIAVTSVFRDQIDPVSASSGGRVEGKSVTWPVVPTLAPRQSVTYTIVGRGAQAGDHRLETRVTTGERPNPIIELESTTVY